MSNLYAVQIRNAAWTLKIRQKSHPANKLASSLLHTLISRTATGHFRGEGPPGHTLYWHGLFTD